jgi:hypothetical protein
VCGKTNHFIKESITRRANTKYILPQDREELNTAFVFAAIEVSAQIFWQPYFLPSFPRRRESRESSPDNSHCPPVIPAKAGIQNALGALLKTFLQPLERFLDGPERPDHGGAGKLKMTFPWESQKNNFAVLAWKTWTK